MANKFVSALEKFGEAVLKIGGYVFLGLQGAQVVQQEVAPGAATASNFLTKAIDIVQNVESIDATLVNPGLSGPQKLQAATTLIAQELSKYGAGSKIVDAASFAKSAGGFAQAAVDYIKSFEAGIVQTQNNGQTATLTPVPAPPAELPAAA